MRTVRAAVMAAVLVLLTNGLPRAATAQSRGPIVLGALYEPKANPAVIQTEPRPEWYFLFLFELLRIFKEPWQLIFATIIIPTILMVLLIAWPFLAMLIFWVSILFLGFGLLAPVNATLAVTQFLGAFSVAGAVFMILELNEPYGGLLRISDAPLSAAIAQLDRP